MSPQLPADRVRWLLDEAERMAADWEQFVWTTKRLRGPWQDVRAALNELDHLVDGDRTPATPARSFTRSAGYRLLVRHSVPRPRRRGTVALYGGGMDDDADLARLAEEVRRLIRSVDRQTDSQSRLVDQVGRIADQVSRVVAHLDDLQGRVRVLE